MGRGACENQKGILKMDLSIIIPTRNRANQIPNILYSLDACDSVNFNWEVLIVDNASEDNTKSRIEELSGKVTYPIQYLYEPAPGLHNCRHRGCEEAQGNVIAYLDDDMKLSKKWLLGAKLCLEGKAHGVVGRIYPDYECSIPFWLDCFIEKKGGNFGYFGILELGNEIQKVDPPSMYGGNTFLKKDIIKILGGFHPDSFPGDYGGDFVKYRGDGETGFFLKFKQHGYKGFYDPIATAYHYVPKKRMTRDYINKRAFAEGISQSFADTRSKNIQSFPDIESDERQTPIQKIRYLKYYLYMVMKKGKGFIKRHLIEELEQKLYVSYVKGYLFHQNQLKICPDLLEWVLQENYFDEFNLPNCMKN